MGLAVSLAALGCSGPNTDLSSDGGMDVGDGGTTADAAPPSCANKATGGALEVNIPTITLTGAITVNGSMPAATERFGTIYLRNLTTGDTVTLGTVGDPMYASKDIVPGKYDVFYSWNSSDTVSPPALPRNANVRIKSGVSLIQTQTLNVDVPTVTLSGSITLNGAMPTDTYGSVYLRNVATADSMLLGNMGAPSYTTKQIVPGTYDIYYTWNTSDPSSAPPLPRNSSGLVRSGVVLTSSQSLNVDVPTITLSGSITVNGATPTDTYGTVYLKNTASGDSLLLGNLGAPSYTTKQIIPGTYDVYYTFNTGDTNPMPSIPRNVNGRLAAGVTLTSSQTYNVDIPTITLSGAITVDGAATTDTFGTVYLKNLTNGDSLLLGNLGAPSYTTKQIIPGTYDAYFTWNSGDTNNPVTLPRNSNGRVLRGMILTTSQTLNVDIPTITLSGSITVDGSMPAERFGTVYLRNNALGDSITLGQVGDPMYVAKKIVPGVYDVYYTWNSGDNAMPPVLPRNSSARIQTGLMLTASQTLNVSVSSSQLSGSIKVNGAIPTDTFGTVYLRNALTGDGLTLGATGDAMYQPKRVIPGIYNIVYGWSTADTTLMPGLPRNLGALIDCVEVLPSTP